MRETRDALGNRVTVGDATPRQRRRAPATTTACCSRGWSPTPTATASAVAFDALGMVVGTAVMGKPRRRRSRATRWTASRADLTQAVDRRSSSPIPLADPRHAARRAPPRASSTTCSPTSARRTDAQPQPAVVSTLARETHDSRPGARRAACGSSTASPTPTASAARSRRRSRPSPGRCRSATPTARSSSARTASRDDAERRQPALGRQRLDHLQQQGQAGPPVRAVLHRHAPLRVRRARSASARCCSTTRSSASSPRCTRTTPRRRSSSTRGGRTTWDVNDTVADVADRSAHRPGRRRLLRAPAATPALPGRPGTRSGIGGALGDRTSSAAAEKAAVHADTPTVAHLDALGRPFLTRRPQPVRCANGADRRRAALATRVELDIEGNQRAVRDAVVHGDRRAASSCATTTTCSATASTRPAWRPASAGC